MLNSFLTLRHRTVVFSGRRAWSPRIWVGICPVPHHLFWSLEGTEGHDLFPPNVRMAFLIYDRLGFISRRHAHEPAVGKRLTPFPRDRWETCSLPEQESAGPVHSSCFSCSKFFDLASPSGSERGPAEGPCATSKLQDCTAPLGQQRTGEPPRGLPCSFLLTP